MDKMNYTSTDRKIEEYRDAVIETTQRMVRSSSVIGNAEEGKPFGKNIYDTLQLMLDICSDLGFRVYNGDGYFGWAEVGEGDDMIGILCHLDIVPVGEGWTHDPFAAEIIDGRMYGRGTIDDKGPTVAALYAVKSYVDLNPGLNKRIRLIFGCNEENDWICMDHYKATQELPTCGFVPDAEFPVIYAEKGISFPILDAEFSEVSGTRILEFEGGSSANMVAGSCRAVVASADTGRVVDSLAAITSEDLNGAEFEIIAEDGTVALKTNGRIAHGSTPWEGINAISAMMYILGKIEDLNEEQARFVRYYNDCIGFDTDGTKLCGRVVCDEASGSLVNNAGMCTMDENEAHLYLNERYPVTLQGSDLQDFISSTASSYGISARLRLDSPPGYVPVDDPMITKLMRVYRHYVDDDTEPLLIGGGTYARSMKNCVAFGPLLPGREELAHCPDEFIFIDDLMLAAKIYAAAITELCYE